MIEIKEEQNGQVSLRATRGVKWNTFIVAIEMLVEIILENSNTETSIDDVSNDIKRIYERDVE